MGAREEAHRLLDQAVATAKAAAVEPEKLEDRFHQLESHVMTVRTVIDAIPVADPPAPVATPVAPPSAAGPVPEHLVPVPPLPPVA